MNKINLLYAKNVITRKATVPEQDLSFLVLVDDLAFDKSVDVRGPAKMASGIPWPLPIMARPAGTRNTGSPGSPLLLATDQSLPGNVQFALRYRVPGRSTGITSRVRIIRCRQIRGSCWLTSVRF
jgi:maltose 6'-phosphate phosphatase